MGHSVGEWRLVEAGDVDGAVAGKVVDDEVEKVQLVGAKRSPGLESVERSAGRFAVEPGQGAQERPEPVMFGGNLGDVILLAES